MKIAFVVHDYHREGGHSRYVAELAERFAGEHDVHVFANGIRGSRASGVTFHRVPAWRLSALTTVVSFLPWTAWMVGRDFDVVHAQGLASLRHNVITAHICNAAWFDARKRSSDPIRPKERVFAAIVDTLERALFRGSRGSQVIAISERVRADLREQYGREADVSVVYHGVDLERFSPCERGPSRAALRSEIGLAEDDLVALYVGDMRKGARTVVDAIARSKGWKLALVSRTPADEYRRRAEELGVADRVHFLPPTDRIERVYAAADAFVFPSECDAFGMVVTEAMASGLPVVVSSEAGASELVEHGESGFVLESYADASEIARWLDTLRDDPELRRSVGERARARASAYTWDRAARETMDVYELAAGGAS